MKRLFIINIIAISLFLSCATTKIEIPNIQGMIYNYKNEPVSDVEIYINGVKNCTSDIYGHFTLCNLKEGKNYELLGYKKNFEDVKFNFSYVNSTQVLYLRMYSGSELLELAEQRLNERDFSSASDFLDRAQKLGGSDLSINYLRAISHFLVKDYERALEYANELIQADYNNSYIYLLLADIYEFGFNDIENCKINLEKAYKLSYDPIIKNRLMSK